MNKISIFISNVKNSLIKFVKNHKIAFIVTTILLFSSVYMSRVMFYDMLTFSRIHLLEITMTLFFFLISMIFFYRGNVIKEQKSDENGFKFFLRKSFSFKNIVGSILIVISLVNVSSFFFTTSKYNPYYLLRMYVASNELVVKQMDVMPHSNIEMLRKLPYQSSISIIKDKITSSEYTIEHLELTWDNILNDYIWYGEKKPRGIFNEYFGDIEGTIGLSSTKSSIQMNTLDNVFDYGSSLKWFNSIDYKIKRMMSLYDLFDKDIDDNVRTVRISEDEIARIVPIINYEGILGIPKFGGVYVIHEDNGNKYRDISILDTELGFLYRKLIDSISSRTAVIEHLSVDEIKDIAYLNNQNLIPEEITNFYVESWPFKNGLYNYFIDKKDLTKVTKIPEETNQQPSILHFNDIDGFSGLFQMFILEPMGKNSGVSNILLFDSKGYDEDITAYEFDFNKHDIQIIGPSRIAETIKDSDKYVKWDKFIIAESKLIFVEDKISGTRPLYLNFVISKENASAKPTTVIADPQNFNIKWLEKGLSSMQLIKELKLFVENPKFKKGDNIDNTINNYIKKNDEGDDTENIIDNYIKKQQ
jgi:hypothetical protein